MSKYSKDALDEYCEEHGVKLCEKYVRGEVRGKTPIVGFCVTENCDNQFTRNFRDMIKRGAYCGDCFNKHARIKSRKGAKYCYNSLLEYCDENDVELNDDNKYNVENVTRSATIKGFCISQNCSNFFEKTFEQLLLTGARCGNCVQKNKNIKIGSTAKFGYNALIEYCKQNNVELLADNDYDCSNVTGHTLIEGQCIRENCCNQFKKNFRSLTMNGGYCDDCVSINRIKGREATCEIKYGIKNPVGLDEIQQKIKNTTMKKFGVENVSQSEEIKDKIKQTNLKNFGVENVSQSEKIKNKIKETSLQRFGVEYPMQNPKILSKLTKSQFRSKQYTFPSGKTISIQGYEHFALDELIKSKEVEENEIITGVQNVPKITYNDEDGKNHCHYVDIYIPSQKRCIEVKSDWTLRQNLSVIFQKQMAGEELGYKYEIWVYNRKGVKTESF